MDYQDWDRMVNQKPNRKLSWMANLDQLRNLIRRSPLDPVFVAVDLEGDGCITQGFQHSSNTELGISILDTRDLYSKPSESISILKTHNFITGSDQFFEKRGNKYLWGIAEWISTGSMLEKLNSCISRDRNVVLVGHGMSRDLAALRALRFNFKTNVIAIFDTC